MSFAACVQPGNIVVSVSSFSAEVMIIVTAAMICCWYKVITEFETSFGKDYVSLRFISSIKIIKKNCKG